MSFYKIKSYAKINLSLGVLGRLKSKFHKIESLIFFIDLHDEIFIRETKENHKVVFYGQFSKKIPSKNTIIQVLNILDKKNLLKKKKYLIKVKKNIPLKSGLGGGSMNASSVLKYLIYRNNINLSKKQILDISNSVGADVILGIKKENSILRGDGKLIRFNKKIRFYVLVLKPIFGCSTKKIYNNINYFSKPILTKKNQRFFNKNTLIHLKNDLENVAFKKYPVLLNIKKSMQKLPMIQFVRMTGSGSCIVGYFNSKKASLNGAKILKKRYKNYWCILSKTI